MMVASAFVGEFVRTVIVMSLSGSALSLLLLLVKPFVRHRLPKTVQYYLWLVVLAALLVPVSKLVVIPETLNPIARAPIHTFVEHNVMSIEEEPNQPKPAADVNHTVADAATEDTVADKAAEPLDNTVETTADSAADVGTDIVLLSLSPCKSSSLLSRQ